MGDKDDDIEMDNVNKIVKFYYSLLKERQDWLMSKVEIRLKNMTALLLFNAAILVVMITILLRSQLPFCSRQSL